MDLTRLRLTHVFSAILQASLVAACKPSPPALESDLCDALNQPDFDDLDLPAVDYLEERVTAEYRPAPFSRTKGTLCGGATDKAKCEEAYRALSPAPGWSNESSGGVVPTKTVVLYTRGDEVGAVATPEALGAFLAPVTPPRAVYIAQAHRYRLACGRPNVRQDPDGVTVLAETGTSCGEGASLDYHVLKVSTDGALKVESSWTEKDGDPNCVVGRRPEGLRPADRRDDAGLAAHLAECAHLEAASVTAFRRLARELVALGAPPELVARARTAAREEVRHARVLTRLARAHGATPRRVEVEPFAPRPRLAFALENAVEGCVRETFGALVGRWQAQRAEDATLAAVMAGIADDETGHAALAWDVAAWVEPQLSAEERAAVESARSRAVGALARSLRAHEPGEDVRRRAGVPSAREATALLQRAAPVLTARAAA